jgi:hypothetical protein
MTHTLAWFITERLTADLPFCEQCPNRGTRKYFEITEYHELTSVKTWHAGCMRSGRENTWRSRERFERVTEYSRID